MTHCVEEIVRREHAEESRERHRHRGNRAGLDHEEERPAVKKTPERTVGFAKIDVLPAGARHHRGQLTIAERGSDRERAGHCPHHKEPTRRTDQPRDVRRDDENARADHRTRDEHCRVEQAESTDKLFLAGCR